MTNDQDVITVESVTSGHPDKVCDQISDAILDALLREDPLSRVAVESCGSHGTLMIGGEVTTRASVDMAEIARRVYRDIGYPEELEVLVRCASQSPDIAMGVDTGGAGDQGMMYGFATNKTVEMLPQSVVFAQALARGLEQLRRTDASFIWLRPDGKTQVTMRDGHVETIVVSTQHDAAITQQEIRDAITRRLIVPIIGDVSRAQILINPTGAFTTGGFAADAGLTGRKIMVDTYGGLVPHGGGAFSGKDATKVDRSAAYMCRFVAKQLVARGIASSCTVSVAYAIGRAEPVMLVARNEEGRVLDSSLLDEFDFRPAAIIERLGLRRPIFQRTAAYGHFGRPELPWEEIV